MRDLKYIAAHLRPCRRELLLAMVLVFLESLLEMLIPLIMTDIVDIGVPDHNIPLILRQGGKMVLCALLALGAGLLYGLGHAVYTKTDPRAEIIREYARRLAEQKGQVDKLDLIASIERLGPQVMRDVRGITKSISTNIDMYTGFVYSMLGIPQDLFTPIFAMARLAGWTAHRMEELYGAGRIIRPAYNSVMPHSGDYVPLSER